MRDTSPAASAVRWTERIRRELRIELPDVSETVLREHLWAAPLPYLTEHDIPTIKQHISMITPKPHPDEVRLEVSRSTAHDAWRVHVGLWDRPGALAAIAGAFARRMVAVNQASISTWRTGIAVDVFDVLAPPGPDWEMVRHTIEMDVAHIHAMRWTRRSAVTGSVTVDNDASPWYSLVEIRAPDRAGLLYRVASALAGAGVNIHQANIATRAGRAADLFWVTTRKGTKLGPKDERRIRRAFTPHEG